jgi:hypothetical protein
MSIRPSIRLSVLSALKNSAPIGRIYVKLFDNLLEKIPISLKLDRNAGYFT